jgi:ferredoxin
VRVHVDRRLCEGHGLCLQSAPEIFDIADDDIAFCIEEHITAHHLDTIIAAVAACPRQAITMTTTDELTMSRKDFP